jgi:PPOX class probable F420-dependent enzyme
MGGPQRGPKGVPYVKKMTRDQAQHFLTSTPHTAKIGIVRQDGSPMVVPIWFDLDADDTIVFTTWHDTIKARSMRREPRVSICVDDEAPPCDYVRIDGTAVLIDDLDLLRRWATRLAARYMGSDRADEYGRRNAVPGELVVRVTPTRIVGRAQIAG